jgi:hypothetical protein
MSTPVGDGASNASGKGPASGYYSNLLWFIFCLRFLFNRRLNLNMCIYNMVTRSLEFVMIKMLILRIKIYRKMPIFLTLTKGMLRYRLIS